MIHTLERRHAGLGDARLDRRFVKIVEDLAAAPEAGIPEASGGWAAAKAAYRFFDNPGVDPGAIRDALRREALELLPPAGPVLAVQDTTSLDFTDHRAAGGLGPLEHPARRGLLLHTTLAVSSDGVPCGLLDRRSWARARPRRAERPAACGPSTRRSRGDGSTRRRPPRRPCRPAARSSRSPTARPTSTTSSPANAARARTC